MPIFDPVTVPNEMGYSGCIDLKYPPFNLAVREKNGFDMEERIG